MTPSVTLRPVTPDDEVFLYQLYSSTREQELARVPWDEEAKKSFLEMQFKAQAQHYQQQYADAEFQIILCDSRPVGRLYVDRRDDELRIIDIALLPEHRNAGIGSALLNDLLGEAAEAGKPVRIHVERFNPALRLYERLGFTHIGDTGVYYLMELRPDHTRNDSSTLNRAVAFVAVFSIFRADLIEDGRHRSPESFAGAAGERPQQRLDLGEDQSDWIQVRAVGRQKHQTGARSLERDLAERQILHQRGNKCIGRINMATGALSTEYLARLGSVLERRIRSVPLKPHLRLVGDGGENLDDSSREAS